MRRGWTLDEIASRYGAQEILQYPDTVRALLNRFIRYEAVRDALGVESYADVDAILGHASEMPRRPSKRGGRGKTRASAQAVQETASSYSAVDAPPAVGELDLLRYLEGFVESQGFQFPPLTLRNYYIALKSKPFVILSGLSGTGKTRLTELLAEGITGNIMGQYLLLPVRPDWTDSSPLLGYHNLLTDQYVSAPFLDRLMVASQPENRNRAFFIVLDEMNLGRVEHYFSDMLSAMETRSRTVPLQGAPGRSVTLPSNVFLTGSVNVDEATHPFSRKVLDRANTLEFTQVFLRKSAAPEPVLLPEIPVRERQRLFLGSRYTEIRTAEERLQMLDASYLERITETLASLNDLLEPRSLQFGYRVRDEAVRYMACSFASDDAGRGLFFPDNAETNFTAALDLQILQKAMPRISGTLEALRTLLVDLERWTEERGFTRAHSKAARMRRRAQEDGFVSFYDG